MSFDKELYWERRKENKRGQGEDNIAQTKETSKPLSIDNSGGVYLRNRATRRNRPPTNNWYTKATNKIKKIRRKDAEAEHKRELARIRKARKKNHPKVS